ncbi:unnamed protein product [Sympodiomycopsis kandeliae]
MRIFSYLVVAALIYSWTVSVDATALMLQDSRARIRLSARGNKLSKCCRGQQGSPASSPPDVVLKDNHPSVAVSPGPDPRVSYLRTLHGSQRKPLFSQSHGHYRPTNVRFLKGMNLKHAPMPQQDESRALHVPLNSFEVGLVPRGNKLSSCCCGSQSSSSGVVLSDNHPSKAVSPGPDPMVSYQRMLHGLQQRPLFSQFDEHYRPTNLRFIKGTRSRHAHLPEQDEMPTTTHAPSSSPNHVEGKGKAIAPSSTSSPSRGSGTHSSEAGPSGVKNH